MSDELAQELSKKLNIVIALLLRQLLSDREFSTKKRKQGTGELVRYLASMGLDVKDIAAVTGSPLTSVRTLLTPARRR